MLNSNKKTERLEMEFQKLKNTIAELEGQIAKIKESNEPEKLWQPIENAKPTQSFVLLEKEDFENKELMDTLKKNNCKVSTVDDVIHAIRYVQEKLEPKAQNVSKDPNMKIWLVKDDPFEFFGHKFIEF